MKKVLEVIKNTKPAQAVKQFWDKHADQETIGGGAIHVLKRLPLSGYILTLSAAIGTACGAVGAVFGAGAGMAAGTGALAGALTLGGTIGGGIVAVGLAAATLVPIVTAVMSIQNGETAAFKKGAAVGALLATSPVTVSAGALHCWGQEAAETSMMQLNIKDAFADVAVQPANRETPIVTPNGYTVAPRTLAV